MLHLRTSERPMRPSVLVAVVVIALGIWWMPATAAASCGGWPTIAAHLNAGDIVFVGTVAELADLNRTALVDVEEIWQGPEVSAQVTVHAGTGDPNSMSSVDRFYRAGVRYLFAVRVVDGELRDDACSATQEWSDDLALDRPVTAATPDAGPSSEVGGEFNVPIAVLVAGLGLALLVGISAVAFRSREP